MIILLLMIPLSLVLLLAAGWAFWWAVRRDQFEDLDTPALDILRTDLHDRAVLKPDATGADGANGVDGPDAPGQRGGASHLDPVDRQAADAD